MSWMIFSHQVSMSVADQDGLQGVKRSHGRSSRQPALRRRTLIQCCDDVNAIANKSETLRTQIKKLTGDGWTIKYGVEGGGLYAQRDYTAIVLDGNYKYDPKGAAQLLFHEVGHAMYPYKNDWSSKSNYVNAHLKDEGAAVLNNIRVQREIMDAGGPDIGINGTHPETYNQIYDQYQKDGDAGKARQAIGEQFGSGEKTSNTHQPYSDYYGAPYDKEHPQVRTWGR